MFTILSHWRNANQNYTEIPIYPSQNGNYQENKQMLVRMQGGSELLYSAGRNLITATMEISVEVPQ
jgi:hypothetical protein